MSPLKLNPALEADLIRSRRDPLFFARRFWDDVSFYDKQRESIESVRDNVETVVVAGNMLGKDYQAGFVCPWFFLTRTPVRIVTTSVADDHLRVLWGEIGRFLSTCRPELREFLDTTLIVNHRDIRKLDPKTGRMCDISYMKGMVAESDEKLQGHHADAPQIVQDRYFRRHGKPYRIPHTLAVIDEASAVDDAYYNAMDTWARRKLIFGNPMQGCTNFFYRAVKGGDLRIKV